MMNLAGAFREVGFRCKYFMKMKQSNEPKDLFALHDAFEGDLNFQMKVQLKDQRHIEEVISDKNITKRYFSEEIHEEKKFLGLMVLGMEFLSTTGQHEDEQEARKIFYDKLEDEIKEVMNS